MMLSVTSSRTNGQSLRGCRTTTRLPVAPLRSTAGLEHAGRALAGADNAW